MKTPRILLLLVPFLFWTATVLAQGMQSIAGAAKLVSRVEIPRSAKPVERTVAEWWRKSLSPRADIVEIADADPVQKGSVRIHVWRGVSDSSSGWFQFRLSADGTGELTASHAHFLYTAFCRVRDDWSDEDVNRFATGHTIRMRVPWLEGNDGFFAALPRIARHYDPEKTIQELARLGCTHVSVNVLAFPEAMEQGVPGEIYPRFYAGSPDLDQFVSTELTRGLYPREYLEANLALLKKNAGLALAYGLTPGLTVCSPRTMPEAFFAKYPYLRGARVDHPFRSYRPRYTATLSHPLVRWHYAELMRTMMKEVPQLGFLSLWTNDSGSGFEFVSTLYAGRNGGAYLIREWKSDTAIARAAGENVVRYLRLLRDAASETNPVFRVITSLSWFGAEKDIILDGLGDRLDLYLSPRDTADASRWGRMRALESKSSCLFNAARAAGNFILGVPAPGLSYDRLAGAVAPGIGHLTVTFDPPSLAPWSINREIVREFQSGSSASVTEIVESIARRWCGADEAPMLVQAWQLAERAVRSFPDVPLYGNSWAFPLYRHWVRPFVPNISAIPDGERAYYERQMIATFNNPTLIDFNADALWVLMEQGQAAAIVRTCDSLVWQPLDEALRLLENSLMKRALPAQAREVLRDQRDRLRGVRCYFRTLRNIAGWVAGVHGYLGAATPEERTALRSAVRATVDDELKNAENLLELWNTSRTDFMPVAAAGENFAFYGANFGELLQRKIQLMKKHRDDTPFIDPNFMWRTWPGCPIEPSEYLLY